MRYFKTAKLGNGFHQTLGFGVVEVEEFELTRYGMKDRGVENLTAMVKRPKMGSSPEWG